MNHTIAARSSIARDSRDPPDTVNVPVYSPGLSDVFSGIAAELRQDCGADWAAVVRVQAGRVYAFNLHNPEVEQAAGMPGEKTAIARVIKTGEPVIETGRRLPLLRQIGAEEGARSVAWLPLLWKGQVTGALAVIMPPGASVSDIGTLKRFALVLAPLVHADSLERQSDALRQQLREYKYLVNVIFQELKTAMTPVTVSISMLEESPTDKRLLKSTVRAVSTVNACISHLTDLTQCRSGTLQLNPEFCNVLPLIRGVASDLTPIYESKNQSLGLDLPSSMAPVRVDRKRFESIIFYLLSNAIELTPEDGDISIRVISEESKLTVSIRDGGQPLPAAVRSQVSGISGENMEADRRAMPGIALALAVAGQIVQAHGGTMDINAPSTGGNQIVINLPSGVKTVTPEERTPGGTL